MEERNLTSWEEFKNQVRKLRKENPDSKLLFRGQENSDWRLTSTLDRKRPRMLYADYYGMITRLRSQIESLTGASWPIPEYPEVRESLKDYSRFSHDLTFGRWPGYAYMIYLRHHGFPSPLLDWSRSQHVAAYFAFSKASIDVADAVSLHVLSERQFTLRGNNMRNVFYPGSFVTTHRRHVLQQSQYTLCVNFDEDWWFESYDEAFNEGNDQQGICWKFNIPVTEKSAVLKELDEYNLHAFSLFGSEEALMDTLSAREFTLPGSGATT